jgi:mono/diheme cytochrome c family protein
MIAGKIFMTTCCLITLTIAACSKSNQPINPGSGFCDTSSVTYTNNILPILQSYCYACHSNSNKAFSNDISLDGYDNAKGWADLGYLVGNVRHDAGFTGMPYGKPKLSACEINTIVAWVNQGGPK